MPPKRPLSTYINEEEDNAKKQKNDREDSPKSEAIRRAKERIAQLREQRNTQTTSPTSKPETTTASHPKPEKPAKLSLSERIAIAKAQSQAKVKKDEPSNNVEKGRGLNVELHPLLQGKEDVPVKPVDNPNINKVNKRGYKVNPYLADLDTSRRKRELKFNESGKYIQQANEVRKEQRLAELKKKIEASTKKAGLEPDLALGEDKYKIEKPPQVEWWDIPLLIEGDYNKINYEAISPYIQHPVPLNAPWERHLPPSKPMYLTKKEMKRIRRNDRSERYKEQQDRIKLGLEPAPPPKVKLSNLMSALTNEAIKDPTAVEKRVRKEVEERRLQHIATNEERKLTKEQRHEKEQIKYEKDLSKGFHTAVFIIDQLVHPSHRFKLDTNAKQLNLVGTMLYNNQFNLIIVEGSEKNIKFYKKLVLNRIKWTDDVTVEGIDYNLSQNKCELLWEGQLRDLHFKKWSQYHADDEQTAIDYLSRFSVENYWREAKIKRQ
ncbi:hypothetical protein BN7_3525 [Wickerhamomyces ciferrii]|uniref:Uncharacterized protein n=1 Tax=Wickerhamomyces ciferrii (strain ATCC 14091 / BCRC 22168 / CBS 111 / JCM 3599 / NBRC 0793 / NRRL Y-1031 F-60-10) TaxID=1206466 RepID=K0KFP8_WICCF|nr:uncharacterized protein BN7_3525 [Wickerhamomyces ciferrii]CCH43970.1 hypothetical protein BN7_3525 [Wickerhamomyces ciferrii]